MRCVVFQVELGNQGGQHGGLVLQALGRREDGLEGLVDQAPGGGAVHGLLDSEREAIVELFEAWGGIDRSHRKLAHRGSYVGQVWVSPSTFRRVLAAQGLVLPQLPAMPRRDKTPWPDWLVWEPNRIWIWDVTHFSRSRRCVFAVIDMVSRYWIATLVSPEETSTQVRVVFDQALVDQGLDELLTDDRLDLDTDDPARPILLAVSDNGPAMTSVDTRAYMAMMAIAQHHGRPHTPTDQACVLRLRSPRSTCRVKPPITHPPDCNIRVRHRAVDRGRSTSSRVLVANHPKG